MTHQFKSADEWMNSFGKFPNDNKMEFEIWRQSKLPESLLPKVNFWNSILTETDIASVQANAFHEAARIVKYESDLLANSDEANLLMVLACRFNKIADQIEKGEYKPV